MKVFGAIVLVFVVLAAILILGYIGFTNDANRFENGITAQYTDNKNVYDNGWKEVKEKAQVPDMYTGQLKKLYDTAMTGRYGNEGSKALFQFIQEQNPTLPSEVFVQIQQSVESFRRRFQQAQTELVARKQAYKNLLTATLTGRFFNQFSGYPHIDLTKFDIVTSDATEKAFEEKRAGELKIN